MLVARCTEDIIELGWTATMNPPIDLLPPGVPPGTLSHGANVVRARLRATDRDIPQRIVQRILETRDAGLADVDPEVRATLDKVSRDIEDLPFQ